MRRYDMIKEKVYEILETYSHGKRKIEGYVHLNNVVQLSIFLANKRKLDEELCATIAILHDIAIYRYNSHFDHAKRSSVLANDILKQSSLFTEDEINCITHAIVLHSNKESIDDAYSECIKDSDLFSQYLQEMDAVFSKEKEKRILLLKKELF